MTKWQRYRKRQAKGEVVLRIVADEHCLAAALLAAGRLDEKEALDRQRVAEATAEIVRDWCARWKYRNG